MSWPLPAEVEIRLERHFGDRAVRCFAERPASVYGAFARAVAADPHAEALVCAGERLSYAALSERAARVSAGLAERGIGRGDRVGMLLGNRVEFAATLLGILRLGAIAVPIGTRLQKPEIEFILGQCSARALVHESSQVESGAEPPPVAGVNEEDTAIILYTSGTTGRPKGAMLTHLNIAHSLLHFQHCLQLGPGERALLAVPASHVTGVVAILLTTWHARGCAIVMPQFKAGDFLELAARERMTYTILVPAMYNLCLLQPDFERFDLSSWRVGGYGGAPMPEATIAALAERLPNLVVGADEKALPPGEAGELWIRGPMVVPGYWDNPEATRQSFSGGYWRSGDVGSMDAQGFVRVFDRLKDMVNRGGYKVYSVEVEDVLGYHPAVLESAIVGKPCPVLGERVHAFVTLKRPVSEDELKRFCGERLADYKVPESFTLLAEPLPRNANGKLLKRALREAVLRG